MPAEPRQMVPEPAAGGGDAGAPVDVSVILVSYNTRELTKQCLASLREKTRGVSCEVWVVDNASRDGSAAMIRECFPDVKLIENGENLGFGRANNRALLRARGTYCFLLNTDTLLRNNAVRIFFEYMESHPGIGACGGNLVDANGAPVASFGYRPTPETMLLRKTPWKLLRPRRNRAVKRYEQDIDRTVCQPVGFIVGADLFLRRRALDAAGLFDERFFLYYEETELQHRIAQAGWGIQFVPEAEIVHLVGKSTPSEQKARMMYRSRILYFRLCFGPLSGWLARTLYFKKYVSELRKLRKEARAAGGAGPG